MNIMTKVTATIVTMVIVRVIKLEGPVYQRRADSASESSEKRSDPQYLRRIQLLSFFPRILFSVVWCYQKINCLYYENSG